MGKVVIRQEDNIPDVGYREGTADGFKEGSTAVIDEKNKCYLVLNCFIKYNSHVGAAVG